jgi:N-acetylglucosamine-6-phosphate deacetylase
MSAQPGGRSRRLGVARAVVDGEVVPGDVVIRDGLVDAVGVDGPGRGTAAPGLVDLQVNGYGGVDLLDADDAGWHDARTALARDGVTAFVANLVTAPLERTEVALQRAARVQRADQPLAARLLGASLEGPYLASARAGVHPVELLRAPDVGELAALVEDAPVVAVVIAPELPGAIEVVRWATARGLLVSLGHSAAGSAQAHAAFDAGARTVTHLFNAMAAPTAREPGLAGAALARRDVVVQLICDGVHVADDLVRITLAAAAGRWVLVTDAMAAAGCGDGDYRLGDRAVSVRGGVARDDDGVLAGSVTTLAGALRHAVRCGADELEAVAAVTTRPAALLGADLGRLRPGDVADVVVLDDRLEVAQVLVAGRDARS